MRKSTPESIEIGKMISTKRKELMLNRKEAAEIIGISLNTLFRYENGKFQTIANEYVDKLNMALDLDIPYFQNKHDLTGKRYGMLTVIEYVGTRGRRHHSYWKRSCDCGREVIARGSHLISGNIKSCGCLRSVANKEKSSQNGLSRSRIYNTYYGMLKRCYLSSNASYDRYGGRGIGVCEEWRSDFKNFYEWAMQNGYGDGKSIDRIDVNGDYCPGNCRWVNAKHQANNRTNTTYITFSGQTRSASEWAEITGIPRVTIKNRIRKGMSPEQALSVRNFRELEGGDSNATT